MNPEGQLPVNKTGWQSIPVGVRVALVLAAGFALIWLLNEPDSATNVPPAPADSTVPSQTDTDALVQNTEDVATMLCREYGPYQTAKEYGVDDPEDFDAVASAYAETSIEGPHWAASYRGCLAGLTEWQTSR
jgi:hypothetical protein